MAVSSYALTSTDLVKAYLGWGADDGQLPLLSVYHDESASATSCTVAVSGNSLILVIAGGANAGTYTYDLTAAANDTAAELVAVLNAAARGFVARTLGPTDAATQDLVNIAAASCFGSDDEQTLLALDLYTLEKLIDAVTWWAEGYTARKLISRAHVEYVTLRSGQRCISLRNLPVTAVTRVSLGREDAIQVQATGSGISAATVTVTSTTLNLRSVASGVATSTDLAFSSYGTLAALATAISAVSGWSASVVGGVTATRASSDLVECYGRNAYDQQISLEACWQREEAYELDPQAGLLYLEGADQWPEGEWSRSGIRVARVDYTAGYSSLASEAPDLRHAATATVASAYKRLSGNSGLQSEKIGDYSYTRFDPGQIEAAVSLAGMENKGMFDRYRRALVA